MVGGRHRFYFVGRVPVVFLIISALLFVNTALLLSLDFIARSFLPKASANLQPCEALSQRGTQYHASELVCWYAGHTIAIQFVLLALLAVILLIFRRRVRYVG
jgi:hypothetical protein